MLTFKFKVKDVNLLPKCFPLTIGGEVDYVKCVFESFSEDWKDVTHKKVLFKNQSYNIVKITEVEDDGTCLVPVEVYIKPGVISMMVYDDVGEKFTDVIKLFAAPDLRIKSTGEISETPDTYPAFHRKIQSLIGDASDSTYELFIEEMEAYIQEYMDSHGGVKNYNELYNKPQIETVELIGNKSFNDLGLERLTDIDLDTIIYLEG